MDFNNDVQRARAVLEDALVDLIYKNFGGFAMHGGTAIWRCYGGNRFSRDVDFYANMDKNDESAVQKALHKLLVGSGYSVREEKYNSKTSTLHIIMRGYGTTGKLDITFAHKRGEAVEYMRVDGTKRIIYALNPEELLDEKIATYSNKQKAETEEIHDLYDILILKDSVRRPGTKVLRELTALLSSIEKRPPEDVGELPNLLLSSAAPSFDEIVRLLKGWLNDNTK